MGIAAYHLKSLFIYLRLHPLLAAMLRCPMDSASLPFSSVVSTSTLVLSASVSRDVKSLTGLSAVPFLCSPACFFFDVLVSLSSSKSLHLIGKIEAEIGLSSSAFLHYRSK